MTFFVQLIMCSVALVTLLTAQDTAAAEGGLFKPRLGQLRNVGAIRVAGGNETGNVAGKGCPCMWLVLSWAALM